MEESRDKIQNVGLGFHLFILDLSVYCDGHQFIGPAPTEFIKNKKKYMGYKPVVAASPQTHKVIYLWGRTSLICLGRAKIGSLQIGTWFPRLEVTRKWKEMWVVSANLGKFLRL